MVEHQDDLLPDEPSETVADALVRALGEEGSRLVRARFGGQTTHHGMLERFCRSVFGDEQAKHLIAILPTTAAVYVPMLPKLEKRRRALELRENGWPIAAIAADLGVSKRWVQALIAAS